MSVWSSLLSGLPWWPCYFTTLCMDANSGYPDFLASFSETGILLRNLRNTAFHLHGRYFSILLYFDSWTIHVKKNIFSLWAILFLPKDSSFVCGRCKPMFIYQVLLTVWFSHKANLLPCKSALFLSLIFPLMVLRDFVVVVVGVFLFCLFVVVVVCVCLLLVGHSLSWHWLLTYLNDCVGGD